MRKVKRQNEEKVRNVMKINEDRWKKSEAKFEEKRGKLWWQKRKVMGQNEESYVKTWKIGEKWGKTEEKLEKRWANWGKFEENTGMRICYISDNFPHFSITEENLRKVMKKMRKVIWQICENLRNKWGKLEKVRKAMRKMRTVWGNMRKVMRRKKYRYANMLHFQ